MKQFRQILARRSLPLRLLVAASLAMAALAGFRSGAEAAPDYGRYETEGPYQVEVLRRALCCDRSGDAVDLYLPRMPAGSPKAPVVTWGNGTWAEPKKYDFLLKHLASWGIAVVATRDNEAARGGTLLDAVELLRKSDHAATLDFGRVAAAGHSQGAGGAVNAAISDPEISAVAAVALPARHHCAPGDCEQIPAGLSAGTSVLFLSGERDPLSPPDALASYYGQAPDGIRKAKASVIDADHNDIQGQPECQFLSIGCRNGVEGFLPYITAWLVWHLGVDPGAGKLFTGQGSSFLTDLRLNGPQFDR